MKKLSLTLVVLSSVAVFAACGGKGKAKEPLKEDDTSSSSSGFSEEDGGGGSSGEGGTSSAAADSTPTTVSCLAATGVCSELTAPGPDAEKAKDKCGTSGGAPSDSGCARDDITATCLIEEKKVTLFYYRAKSPESKGAFKKGESSCKADNGVWTPTKAEKPKPAGKQKPKGKKK